MDALNPAMLLNASQADAQNVLKHSDEKCSKVEAWNADVSPGMADISTGNNDAHKVTNCEDSQLSFSSRQEPACEDRRCWMFRPQRLCLSHYL